jgi:hypothetical protein
MLSVEKSRVKDAISAEFDRQTAKYPKLFEAFAKEDPSILSDE